MVSVNFRINDGIENQKIIEFFKDIGYEYIGANKKSIKVEDDYLNTEIFIRNTKNGRYHIYLAFSKKYSGTEEYPQLNIFLHFDIKKIVKGKEKHFPDRNEKRNMKEIYRIEKIFKTTRLGFLEVKDIMCAHATIDLEDKEKLLEILGRDYTEYDKWKFRKRFNLSQCTISLHEQVRFIHIVCVYAKIVGKDHDLIKAKAIKELDTIIDQICDYKVIIV